MYSDSLTAYGLSTHDWIVTLVTRGWVSLVCVSCRPVLLIETGWDTCCVYWDHNGNKCLRLKTSGHLNGYAATSLYQKMVERYTVGTCNVSSPRCVHRGAVSWNSKSDKKVEKVTHKITIIERCREHYNLGLTVYLLHNYRHNIHFMNDQCLPVQMRCGAEGWVEAVSVERRSNSVTMNPIGCLYIYITSI